MENSSGLLPSLYIAVYVSDESELNLLTDTYMGTESTDTRFDGLPEECVAMILSHTSPADACRASLLSSTFRSAAESDLVWEKFLPHDYQDILSRAVNQLNFSSKKELFYSLCTPLLIDGAKKSFQLDKFSAKSSYILSARDLRITWGDDPMYWSWRRTPESRFQEEASLRTTSWLEIEGKIKTRTLTPNTKYGAYLIMKISDRAYGLDSVTSEVAVTVGSHRQVGSACLCNQDGNEAQRMEWLRSGGGRLPCRRDDGWSEIEMGEFSVNEREEEEEEEEEVKMSLREVKGPQLKGGLVIEGIEVRPLSF